VLLAAVARRNRRLRDLARALVDDAADRADTPLRVTETRTNHWKLGLFVVVSILVVVVATFWLGAQRFERDSFQAVTYFDESVQGLEVGSPVKWRGVTIGTVAELTVAPDSGESMSRHAKRRPLELSSSSVPARDAFRSTRRPSGWSRGTGRDRCS